MPPACGLMLHVTRDVIPVTVAENCCVLSPCRGDARWVDQNVIASGVS